MRTMEWDHENDTLKMIDQRLLPGSLVFVSYTTAAEVAESIRTMVVRGAPAIGAAAAFGMSLAAKHSRANNLSDFRLELEKAAKILVASRPTAVNLSWAVNRMIEAAARPLPTIEKYQQSLLEEAQLIADEDVETNRRMAEYGSALIDDGDTIIHHCNTGALATVDWGTALGVIRMAHEQGKRIHVLVDETRPRLQGARLTAWELTQMKIPFHIISDGAAGHFLLTGQANKVLFGADRVAANGDVANKIGSYMLALAAHANHVPVYSVFPYTTVDLSLSDGSMIPIEERSEDEVLDIQVHGENIVPRGAHARNPAFDVTPNHLFTGLITDRGVVFPPFDENLTRMANS